MMTKYITILLLACSVCFGAAYQITTPYDGNDVLNIKYCQSGNIMYIVDGNNWPQQLTRTSHTSWDIKDINITNGPFLMENSTATTIAPSAITGTGITLTASADVFNENQVGALWQITHTLAAESVSGKFTADGNSSSLKIQKDRKYNFTTHGGWTGDIILQRSFDGGTIWKDVIPYNSDGDGNISYADSEIIEDALYRVHAINWTEGSCTYNLLARSFDLKGVAKITGYTSATEVTADVKHDFGSTIATKHWNEGAWSDDNGYPRCVTFYEERLVYASTKEQPQTIWLSETDNWTNFKIGPDDTDPMQFTIASDRVDNILWITPLSKLLIGTLGGEWTLSSSGIDEPLTPNNIAVKRQSTYGSANMQAQVMNNNVVFVQRQERKIRKLQYSFELDNWIAPDLTILSEHITRGGIRDMAIQNNPYPILWVARDDGKLLGLTLEDTHEIVGWHRHNLGGDVESIAVIPGEKEDEVWFIVDRTIDGNNVKYVEQMQPFDWGDDQNDIFFVDCGLTYKGTETNSVTGLDHLEGETVAIVGDGLYLGTDVVESNSVQFDANCSTVHVGLPYTAKLLPMKLEMSTAPGQLFGENKRITEVTTRFYKTLNCKIGPSWTDYDKYDFKEANNELYDGDILIEFDGDYETAGNIYIKSDEPYPITILALMAKFDVNK